MDEGFEQSARGSRTLSTALEKMFSSGTYERKQFQTLCTHGCDWALLLSFLIITKEIAKHPRRILDYSEVPKSEVKKLPNDLIQIANRVEQVNADKIVGPVSHLTNRIEGDATLSSKSKTGIQVRLTSFRSLPLLIRAYAEAMRESSGWLQRNFDPRTYTSLRKAVYDLIEYVKSATQRPHYGEVADLLAYSYRSDRGDDGSEENDSGQGETGDDETYKLLSSPDALKQLYLRHRRQLKSPPK